MSGGGTRPGGAGHHHEGDGQAHAHGAAGPTPRANPFADKSSRTRVIAVSSGKGGVGKSTVTVNLAVGPGAPGLLGGDPRRGRLRLLGPLHVGHRAAPDACRRPSRPARWPTGCGASRWAFSWTRTRPSCGGDRCCTRRSSSSSWTSTGADLDFLVLDLPPGTGDVAMSIAQFVPRAEVLVVTTPQAAAERVAQRAAVLARQLRLPVRGVVENQSWFTGDDGKRYELFGHGGGEQLAKSLGVALLAQIPFLPVLAPGGRRRRAGRGLRAGRRGRAGLRRPRRACRRSRTRAGVPSRALGQLSRASGTAGLASDRAAAGSATPCP